MKSSWFPILLIVTLLGLLVLLATLQYQWLGQISNAEQVRLEARLKDDAKRFAEDFNNEIHSIYFMFQFSSKDWNSFGNRYAAWQEKTNYKNLIKDFYYVNTLENNSLSAINKEDGKFQQVYWTDELKSIKKNFTEVNKFEAFTQDGFALIIPFHKDISEIKKLIGTQQKTFQVKSEDGEIITENIIGPSIVDERIDELITELKAPAIKGFLIIRLNENLIKEEVLPTLAKKYFSESDGGSYKISILGDEDVPIYQTHKEKIEKPDFQQKLFDINPSNVFLFAKNRYLDVGEKKANNRVVFRNKFSTNTLRKSSDSSKTIDIDVARNIIEPKIKVFENNAKTDSGFWTLNIQHIDGSLEQFISNTRRRNLAISFGILSLLALSIILIFLSSQRAKLLAQKQMDFVSSVSHEFRTPLAVIYSAGENLSDGVIDEREKISDYGGLIKREGKKLSGMVEQILEFAGANSGKRKFDFKNVEVRRIIDVALAECQSIIDEKEFEIEKDVPNVLPNIIADEKALTLAVQNLINNSLKYSNGNKWLKVSALNDDKEIKIVVEDKGIGISSKDMKKILEPFYRAENVIDEQISGNGLGLSLVKQIVDAHKGSIDVNSEIGKGSKFTLRLPLNI